MDVVSPCAAVRNGQVTTRRRVSVCVCVRVAEEEWLKNVDVSDAPDVCQDAEDGAMAPK